MTVTDYYDILGIPVNSGTEEIKKAYRKKAYQYHPDINHSPEAKDLFISATEAYEFLISNHGKLESDQKAYEQAFEEWRKYRQDRSRRKATAYARAPYNTFKRTRFYKTTRIFDGTRIIYGFIVSILIIIYTVYGYIYRLKYPWRDEKPSVVAFILLLSMGLIFLIFSAAYLKSWLASSRKNKSKKA